MLTFCWYGGSKMKLGNSNINLLGSNITENKYIGDGEISFDYESSHSIIVKNVHSGKKILDLGCSDGIIGNYLNKHKNCEVFGCDINEESIKIAKSRNCYKKIFHSDLDIDKTLDEGIELYSFDYVIIADVLEHLKNPENAIELACKYLKNNGEILICVPNIANENVIVNLMNDKFNYNDLGILDNTHLRFFTENSFIDFINNLNKKFQDFSLKCDLLEKIKLFDKNDYDENREIIDLIENSNSFALQFLFSLKKVDNGYINLHNNLEESTKLIKERINVDKDILYDDLSSISLKKKKIENENLYLKKVIEEKDNYILYLQSINNLYNFKIYKFATVFRNLLLKVFPYGSIRRKIIRILKNVVKKFFFLFLIILKTVFKCFTTKKYRRKILKKIKNHETISGLIGVMPFSHYLTEYIDNNEGTYPIQKIYVINKTIGVHLHLYYEDLADEFVRYLSNIPYQFDLYISVSSEKAIKRVKKKFKKILNLNKLVVKVSKNAGRDYGPMFVLFNNDLKKYDYILHIHSKKSLRTGNSQDEWRNYLLSGILGTPYRVINIISLMETQDVGVVYQDDYSGCVYWCHTWLGASSIAREYLKKLDIKYEDEYLDFSAGSMFFVKTDAVKQLFDLNLTWDDFGIEENKSDGTLAYFFERIFVLLAQKNGYKFSTYNENKNRFLYNYAEKNLKSYNVYNVKNSFECLSNFNVVSFDIFDTLITREIYNPDDIYTIIEDRLPFCKKDIPNGLLSLRKKAESLARTKYQRDVNIHEIYNQFSELSALSFDKIELIKKMEIELELELCIPRKDMLKIYNKLLEQSKQIVLISDMYLTKDIIEKILEKCGYRNYFELLVSCEINKRKDTGEMWKYFFNKYKNALTVHVGDNEQSDVHIPCNLGKNIFHIMQGKKMYQLSPFNYNLSINYDTQLLRGLIVNKCLFNSPFYSYNYNLFDLGYGIIGPLIFCFLQYVNRVSKNYDEILFFAREGYYFEKIYKKMYPNDDRVKYFLISRRAITVTNLYTKEDVMKLFLTQYNGSIKKLFLHRLGIYLKNEDDFEICCPQQNYIVEKYVDKYLDEILNKAKSERNNYLKYINKTIDSINHRILVVDLGYSGTSQVELSKLLKKKIDGAYLVVSDNLKPLSLGCKVYSCYNDIIYDNSFDDNPLGKYSLILESFLTSPEGQLICFDENAYPKYLYESKKKYTIKLLDKINDGIIQFVNDYSSLNNKDYDDINIDKEFIINNFKKFVESGKFDSEMLKVFKVEDFYCGNNIVNVLSKLF